MKIVLLFLFLGISLISNAQSFEKSCRQPFKNIGFSIINTSDNHILIAGGTFAGVQAEILLLKADTAGSVIWMKKIVSGSSRVFGNQVFECLDGNYLISGESHGSSQNGIVMIKVDTAGNVIWEKTYDSIDFYNKFIMTRDSGFAFLSSSGGGGNFEVTKTDQYADIIWTKNFSIPGTVSNAGFDMIETDASEILVSAYLFCPVNCDYFIKMKLDSLGNQIWIKTINANGGFDKIAFSGNSFFITSNDGPSNILVRTDTAGNVLWSKTFSITNSLIYVRSVKADNSTGIYFTGVLVNTSNHGFLAHSDSSGTIDLFKTYDNVSEESIYDLSVGDSNQIYLTGSTISQSTDSFDVFYLKDDLRSSICSVINVNLSIGTMQYADSNLTAIIPQSLILNTIINPLVILTDTSIDEITICSPTSQVKEVDLEKIFFLYPNPVMNYFNIECKDGLEHELLIFDSYSRLLLKRKFVERINNLNVESLPSGIYTAIVTSKTKAAMFKTFIRLN